MNFVETATIIGKSLKKSVPKYWDGKKCILEMKNMEGRQWRQMEWIGFYFQFKCENILKSLMTIPGPKFGNVEFDGFLEIPWDFKAHAINTSSHQIIVNDSEAIAEGIKNYNAVGVILALGKVEYNDDTRTFQKWHDSLKGEQSKYVQERISRGAWSRLRKTSFDLNQISFIKLTDDTLVKCGSFQEGFRNSNGSPRRPKVLIDLELIEDDLLYFIEF